MTIKEQIKAVFDTLNLSYVTARNGRTGYDKVILRKRAKAGGSMGPMTVTNAHLERCVAKQEALIFKLRDELTKQFGTYSMVSKPCHMGSSDMLNLVIQIPLSEKMTRVITFTWQVFGQYVNSSYDPSYEAYWYVMDAEDKKTADIQ